MQELISIVSTLYNYERYLRDLIDSCKAQTWDNWELIIVDDGSTDNPLPTITECADGWKGGTIRYIPLSRNFGYSYAKNIGIDESRGEYIVMIDADDMLIPDSLKHRYEVLQNTDKLWVHGNVLQRTEDGKYHVSDMNKRTLLRRELLRQGKDLNTYYHHRLIHAQGVMVRREFHRRLGLYDASLRFSSDNEMFRRAIRFGILPEYTGRVVAVYRCHTHRMSKSPDKKKQIKQVKQYILDVVEKRFKEGINETNTWVLQ